MTSNRPVLRAALRHLESGLEFDVATRGRCEVGRRDPQAARQPDLDLSSLDPERSISRWHAVIENTDDGWILVEEKGTLNGTFLNERQLRRGTRYPLQPKDRIRLASLEFELVVEQR